jgi:hypothetical protein
MIDSNCATVKVISLELEWSVQKIICSVKFTSIVPNQQQLNSQILINNQQPEATKKLNQLGGTS